jgi:SAM-dependent methyltransferase
MYDAERAQGEAFADPAFPRSDDAWAGRAGRYAAATERTVQPDPLMQHVLPYLRPIDTVLDIGAGTGRYVAQLARVAARVIAIEPSAAMRTKLAERVAREQLSNVEIQHGFWPLDPLPQADVAFSAHVVYGVREIGPFLLGMHAAARRQCLLGLGLRPPGMALAPCWSAIHGEPRLPLPGALEALCCLHQLGLPASLTLLPHEPSFRFADAEQAFNEIHHRLRLSPDPARDQRLREAIHDLLQPTPQGDLMPPDQPRYAAVIGWVKDEGLGVRG